MNKKELTEVTKKAERWSITGTLSEINQKLWEAMVSTTEIGGRIVSVHLQYTGREAPVRVIVTRLKYSPTADDLYEIVKFFKPIQ